MKRFILFTFSILLTFTIAIAQDGINYQGAATDANGDELTNQNISIRASVLSASANGNLEWEETHSATTDQFGLFNVVIGQGTNTTNGATANFDDMDWGSANHFLKIEMDATGGTNYAMIGTTQMMSVPYALYAKSAGIDSTVLANMIAASGLDSSEIAALIENAIGDSPFYNGSSNQNNNIANNNNVIGKRIYVMYDDDRIYETDSAGSFETNIYESIELDDLFIDKINQELYFLESNNSSSNVTYVKKTSLNNFNPQTVLTIPLKLTSIGDFKINPNDGKMYWSNQDSYLGGIWKYDNGYVHIYQNNSVRVFDFTSTGDIYHNIHPNSTIYSLQTGNQVGSSNSLNEINSIVIDRTTNNFFVGGNTNQSNAPLVFNDQGVGIYTTGLNDCWDLSIDETNQIIYVVEEYGVSSVDYSGNNIIPVYSGGNRLKHVDILNSSLDSLITGTTNSFYSTHNIQDLYVMYDNDKIYEVDSTSHQNIYESIELAHLFIDKINQELYFLESNNASSNVTYVKKTSLNNFNPQTVLTIPLKLTSIGDFKINPNDGKMYWSNKETYLGGIWKYDNGYVHIYQNNSVRVFDFTSTGDIYHNTGYSSTIYSLQTGNQVGSSNSLNEINSIVIDRTTNNFFVGGNTNQSNAPLVFNDQGVGIYTTGLNDCWDLSIDETNQIIYVVEEYGVSSVDYSGNNIIPVYSGETRLKHVDIKP